MKNLTYEAKVFGRFSSAILTEESGWHGWYGWQRWHWVAFGPVSEKFKNIIWKRFLDFIVLSWIYGMDLR
jgi:hypothetical protein